MRDGNKIYFPEKNIFIMDNHKWAFYIWELALMKGIINKDSVMFHIDAHLDDLPFVLEDFPEYKDIREIEDLYNFTDEKIGYDQFIWPSFGRGTINNIIYVSDFPSDPFEDWAKHFVKGRKYEGLRLRTIEQLKDAKINFELDHYEKGNTKILNLDLDYFNEDDFWGQKPKLKSDQEVKESLLYLKNMYKWDLITVALSPECCGGEDACEHLYKIFLEVFELDINKGKFWEDDFK